MTGDTSQLRAKPAPGACAHCGLALPAGGRSAYCCAGCEAVASVLRAEGLLRYYELAGDELAPIGAPPADRSQAWLEPLLHAAEGRAPDAAVPAVHGPSPTAAAASGDALCTLDLDVQGIRCAACVWLMEETARRAGAAGATVNPALGKVRLVWQRDRFDVPGWVGKVERFGYRLGPSRKTAARATGDLTWRLGICAALTMNVMVFSLSFYFGLGPSDGEIYRLFGRLSLALSTVVVAVGGWPFLRAAAQGLRLRMLHLDLPIALGIVLVYGTSVAQAARGHGGQLTYFDTLNTFITLMILGRFLQERVLERNRRFLLADDGAEGIFLRRIDGPRVDVVAAPAVRRGDRLLVAPGELVPVDADLTEERAVIATDWITGESAPRSLVAGDSVPAGSFNAGRSAFTVVGRTDFADSPLGLLLRQAAPAPAGRAGHRRFWDRLARRWVITVLASAAAGLAIWLPHGAGPALDVAAALLVVTCPCAIGIALPLGYEITQSRLRRDGFYVRSSDLLDRLLRVRRVVFDKTGTLTLSRLELAAPESLRHLPPSLRDLAYNMACRSAHPVAACIAAALARAGAVWDAGVRVVEVPGRGLQCRRTDGEWRLGRGDWACFFDGPGDHTVLGRDGAPMARFAVREALRPGARAQVRALGEAGFALHLLSGDTPARTARLAEDVGIELGRARGGRSPIDKANDVALLGEGTLFLGDGVNDSLAFDQALAAGTVAIDRPVLPSKSDFFLVGESLAPLARGLAAARRLRHVVRRVLAVAFAYNAVAVTAALLGAMSPVRAAIFMPLSSLSLLLYTVRSLRERPPEAAPAPLRAAEALT